MHFTQEELANGVVLELAGSFTFKDHYAFRSMLDVLNAGVGRHHVLDLSRVEFLDSAALGMLMVADEEARAGGWTLTLRKPSEQLTRLMHLASLDLLFTLEK